MTRVGWALIAVFGVLRGWMLSKSWFEMDDLAFVANAWKHESITWDYLTAPYSGHVMPAGHALTWLLTHTTGPYEFFWWAATLWVMLMVLAAGMLRLLVTMFGRRWAVLIPLAGFLFWTYMVEAAIWWAAGINQLPFLIAMVFGTTSWVHYLRGRRTLHLVASVLWPLFGLAFFEKTLFVFGVYGLLAFGWFVTGKGVQRLTNLWLEYRRAILVLVVVAGAYVYVYARYALSFPEEDTPSSYPQLFANQVGRTLVPTFVGGPFQWSRIGTTLVADTPELLLVLSWVLVGLVVWYLNWTRTKSKRAWVLLVIPMALNLYLLSSARPVGPTIALAYRYQTEACVLTALALGLAMLPLVGAPEQNTVRPSADLRWERPRIVIGVTVAITLAAIFSNIQAARNWDEHNTARPFMAKVEASVAAAETHPVPMIDTGMPADIMWITAGRVNTYQYVYPFLDVDYVTTAVDEIYIFDDKGRITYAGIDDTRTATVGPGCGIALDSSSRTVPLSGPLIEGGWWMQMDYASEAPVDLVVTAGPTRREVSLPSGIRTFYMLTTGDFDSITFERPEVDSKLCITQLRVGAPEPGLFANQKDLEQAR